MSNSHILTDSPELLNRAQAAEYLGGISPKSLAIWQSTKRYHLPIVKIGRLVRYRREDLDKFLEQRRIANDEN